MPMVKNAKTSAVNWTYDKTPINLLGPNNTRFQKTPHVGEHHIAEYKGHKLRILRIIGKKWPDEAHSELEQSWQGELDGVAIAELKGEQSNPIAQALIARVDALAG